MTFRHVDGTFDFCERCGSYECRRAMAAAEAARRGDLGARAQWRSHSRIEKLQTACANRRSAWLGAQPREIRRAR